MKRESIIVSFSGGRTSAYMLFILLFFYSEEYNIVVVFMDTGLEHEKTYEFIKKFCKYFEVDLRCIATTVHHEERKGSTFHEINLEDIGYNIAYAKSVCEKYGMFGVGYLHCTRELKINPFNNFVKSLKISNYRVAIGIRYDELDRVDENYIDKRLFYPLLDLKITKKEVNDFWENMPFDLEIPEYLGNCVTCWKKSNKKLEQAKKDCPDRFSDIIKLEKYKRNEAQNMFRGNKDSQDIGCKESCEVF